MFSGFLKIADHERKIDIENVIKRIRNRKLPLITGQLVATLSFGFWAGVLQPRYNPYVWSLLLRGSVRDLPPDKTRYVFNDLAGAFDRT